MRIQIRPSKRGIALIIVMVVIIVLGALAGGFAYSMKVETTLARTANNAVDLEWLGRSGVEKARYILSQQLEPYDSLNQIWAGGPGGIGETNSVLVGVSLENNELGQGHFSLKITDTERKVNINVADEMILRQALNLMGADATHYSATIDSILDWRDPDDDPHISGKESDYYLRLEPQPYFAKNGPIDDLSELLLVYGVTPEMYWGAGRSNAVVQSVGSPGANGDQPAYTIGFVDLFTAIGARTVNVNTASAEVLQLVLGVDQNSAQQIVSRRSEFPFSSPQQAVPPGAAGVVSNILGVKSTTFEVVVDAEMNGSRKQYRALLRRGTGRDIQVLYFCEL